MSKTERAKFKDQVRLSIKTPFTLSEIPYAVPPDSLVFDIRRYKEREWILLFFERGLYEEIEKACEKRGLNVRYVLYGTLLKLKKMLE